MNRLIWRCFPRRDRLGIHLTGLNCGTWMVQAIRIDGGPSPDGSPSPTAFDNTRYSYTDSSSVETIASFPTNFSDEELIYLLQERGNGNSGGTRFVDGTGFVLYVFEDLPLDMESAKLGVTVGNNFVVSAAAYYFNPEDPVEVESYTVLANSMELYDGFEQSGAGNLKLYEFRCFALFSGADGRIVCLIDRRDAGKRVGAIHSKYQSLYG